MRDTQLFIQDLRLSLKRYPSNQFDKSLRAWDAADEYTINHVAENLDLSACRNIVIFNDSFGALSCALSLLASQANIIVFTDSTMAKSGIEQNLKACNIDKNKVSVLSVLESTQYQQKDVDLVLLKIPRTLAYLDFMLGSVSLIKQQNSKALLVSSAMVKLVTSSSLKKFDKFFSETKTSLAYKKSRLVFSDKPHLKLDVEHLMQEHNIVKTVNDDSIKFSLLNYPNVFCREQVDIGARYMLDVLPDLSPYAKSEALSDRALRIIDLGCGNGILATQTLLQASTNNINVHMHYVDESFMAIASAQLTLKTALTNNSVNQKLAEQARFSVDHCLRDFLSEQENHESADVILCNPPFHQQSTQLDDIAWTMFLDAHKALKMGGELRIVGNRHLEHRAKLSKLFGGCKVIASNKKFVVLSSIKQAD